MISFLITVFGCIRESAHTGGLPVASGIMSAQIATRLSRVIGRRNINDML
jgi:hypothetical protein